MAAATGTAGYRVLCFARKVENADHLSAAVLIMTR